MATLAPAKTVPAHVPPELVVDIDIYNIPGGAEDPQGCWRIFKGRGPLVWSPYNNGHWIATEGKDVFRFFRDPEHFSSSALAIPDPGDRMLPIQADPPEHAKHRANITFLVTPERVEALEPRVRELTIQLIEGFRARGECEFVSEFALQLPLIIFLEMMGLPLDDRLMLRDMIERFLKAQDGQKRYEIHMEVHHYLEKWVNERRANPGNDAISRIIASTIDGRQYTQQEVLETLTLLLHAGLDTLMNMLGFIALHLARNPKDRDYIRNNPDKMHNIIQELLRRYTGPQLGRKLAKDFTHAGVTMKQGDMIMLSPFFFNQDETTLDNPDEVDFERQNIKHITFGSGPHTCAGALLARREIMIFLQEFLTRIPDFTIDPARPPKLSSQAQNSVEALWLTWPTAKAG
jgi:cytochrome P450